MFVFKYVDYYHTDNKKECRAIKAISSYEGKTIVGTAYLHPNDVFDPKVGTEIARLRCERKILERKKKRFERKQEWNNETIEFYKSQIAKLEKRNRDYANTVNITEERIKENEKALENLLKN